MNVSPKSAFLFGVLIVFATAASAQRYRAKGMKGRNVDTLFAFAPISRIAFFNGDTATTDFTSDSLSAQGRAALQSVMQSEGRRMRMSPVYITQDTALQSRITAESFALMEAASRKHYDGVVPITPVIDSITKSQGLRFALCTAHYGFTHNKAGIKDARRAAFRESLRRYWGLIGLEAIYSLSGIAVFILDTEQHRAVYFKTDTYTDAYNTAFDPGAMPILRRQWLRAFHQFYWLTPQDML